MVIGDGLQKPEKCDSTLMFDAVAHAKRPGLRKKGKVTDFYGWQVV
jgi:hypothetical protein